jgi:hypothetical protein
MGKQIRIYLADGSPVGLRHAEITNWTGQALSCPRARFGELRDWPEVKRPGVYFLFGIDETTGLDAVYVGESEVVVDRLASHITGKEFWSEVIAFTSKDDNLTKGHVRYLEARLIEMAFAAKRYVVTNSANPQLPSLPRPDRDAMEEFLGAVRTLLGVLGHRVLEPIAPQSARPEPRKSPELSELGAEQRPMLVDSETLYLNVSDVHAVAVKTDEGLVVLAGATAALQVRPSLTGGYQAIRQQLLQSGALEEAGGVLRLQRDALFSSPTQAAAVLVGYSINGRDAWKTKAGQTLAAVEAAIGDSLLKDWTSSS